MKNKKCLKVIGNKFINGVIKVSGSKNAALPIIAASLLCKDKVTLRNVPNIVDVNNLLEILKYLNVKFVFKDNELIIDPSTKITKNLDIELMKTFRASYYLIPVLLEENTTLEFIDVGGCSFEKRPIDIHLDLLRHVGAKIQILENRYIILIKHFKELNYNFNLKTVGGTINAILLGIKTKKKTVLKNYSREPEVMDFISFLIKSGLDIEFNEDTISFTGKSSLNEIEYEIMNDRIEAETFALLGLALGRVGIFGFNKEHHSGFLSFLDNNKLMYTLENDFLLITKDEITLSNDIVLDTYPSLSTDIGPILFSYLLLGRRMFLIRDNVYKTRLSKLRFFQSSFNVNNDLMLVNPCKLNKENKIFYGSNLRDTMGYLFYSLTHEGTFYIYGLEHICRGYEDIINKLVSLNCSVEEIHEE